MHSVCGVMVIGGFGSVCRAYTDVAWKGKKGVMHKRIMIGNEKGGWWMCGQLRGIIGMNCSIGIQGGPEQQS